MPDEILDNITPSGVWADVLTRVRPIREEKTGKRLLTSVSGPEQFGLSQKVIHKLIEELPNATKCTRYIPALFDAPKKPKKRRGDAMEED